jgi:lipopolysaccharide transport system permease protein
MTDQIGQASVTAPSRRESAVARGVRTHRISATAPALDVRLRELLASRDLFLLLFGRELRVRYRQTALGVAWIVLQPLVPAVIFAAVFGTFARLPSLGVPYLLFALSGLVLFGLFSSAASRSASSFVRDAAVITKVYFPRSVLPLATGSTAVVDFLVALVLLVVLAIVAGVPPSARLVALPLAAAAALGLGLALGLAVAALSARFRDFLIGIPFALQVALYASPVLYSTELVPPAWRAVYALNPLVALVEGFRWSVLGTPAPDSPTIVNGLLVAGALVVVALAIFDRAARDVSDVI